VSYSSSPCRFRLNSYLFSASLSINKASGTLVVRACLLDHLSVCRSVCLSVRKVYRGKTADWIRIPFGVVSGVGLGIGVLDFGGDRQWEEQFWGQLERNKWGLCNALFSNYFGDLFISATCHISMSLLCYEIDVHL